MHLLAMASLSPTALRLLNLARPPFLFAFLLLPNVADSWFLRLYGPMSHGLVLGSTITLSERDGGLLTAFLALFVSAAGAACWRILSYAFHQYRAKQDFQAAVHHQQQAILRNTGSPGGAAWQLGLLIWYWRKHAVKPVACTLPLIAMAILNLTLFAVAGDFSS